MRISWFRSQLSATTGSPDSMDALVAAVARRHEVTEVGTAAAHDTVWRWHRGLIDLPVYELDGAESGAFMWPYMARYPGVALVLARHYAAGHATALVRQRRRDDGDAEDRFSRSHDWRSLAIPLTCSRVVALPGGGMTVNPPPHLVRFAPAMPRPAINRAGHDGPVRIGLITPDERSRDLVEHAAARVRDAGLAIDILMAGRQEVLAGADILMSMPWPPTGRIGEDVLAAMALGIPSIVVETVDVAGWPSLNPQSWQPREEGPGVPPPVGISIDARDEEHSLLLTLRRLAADTPLRERLATAARERWAALHEPDAAARGFDRILDLARNQAPPPHPPDWPAHFTADASGTARRILDEFSLQTDVLG
ncbi:MAG: hypothetical protein Q7J25_14960 [Vicinamibacterales bacterium]|nr:hypothetical protein [Vicinamibacterales bacterium]